MSCQQHVLLFSAFCLSFVFLGTFAFEKKIVEETIRVSDADRTIRNVDINHLRDKSIDAYMTGGENSLQGTGYNEKDLALTAVIIILLCSIILMCATYTCSKHLMRDFYRMHKA